jgi:hypothetical protein
MARWCFLLAFFVLSAFGQSSQNAVDPTRITKEAARAILGNNLGQSRPALIVPGASYIAPLSADAFKETSCSVPLVEMKIPKDVNFAIGQVPAPSDFRDNMPVAHGLPPCPTGR